MAVARVQLVIPDVDRTRFVHQARREGWSLSAWVRTAPHERLARQSCTGQFASGADLESFFGDCDALEGPDREPDWNQHRAVIDQSRRRGAADT